jgi:hypothetical protein
MNWRFVVPGEGIGQFEKVNKVRKRNEPMITRSKSNQFQSRIIPLTVFAALVTAGTAFPQAAASNAASGNAAKDQEGGYSLFDVSAFFGTQWFQVYQGNDLGYEHYFQTKEVTGERLKENLSKYVSLEEAFTLGFNRLELKPAGDSGFVSAGSRNGQYSLVAVLNLTPRDAKFRPYFVVGPAVVRYTPTTVVEQPTNGPFVPVQGGQVLYSKSYAALVYGIGAEYYMNRHIGFTYDLRGLWSMPASFGLPSSPNGPGLGPNALYVSRGRDESALAFTVGVSFRFGYHEPPPPVTVVTPPPPPPPPPPPTVITVSAIQGAHDVCPGDNIRLSVSAQGWEQGQTPVYQWTVNNQPAPGGRATAFNLPTTDGPGQKAVRVTVTAGGAMASSGPVNVLVRNLAPPTIQFAVNPTTIAYGDRLPLNAQATGSDCGGPATIRYTANDGAINGTTFDSSSMTFNPNGAGTQQKVVAITATATDTKNQTATANANVTVVFKVPASRQDIVFPNRSSRVNNAAKRYLIDVLTPKLRADPNSTVILIGHRDMSETGRPAATLDTQRVLNTAAVLSAGKGICPQLDLSRVQVAYVGTDQTDPPMPFGDNSVKERGGQSATDARAQFRRVEIWFVPGGADKPNVPGLMPAPAQLIQAKGCPR